MQFYYWLLYSNKFSPKSRQQWQLWSRRRWQQYQPRPGPGLSWGVQQWWGHQCWMLQQTGSGTGSDNTCLCEHEWVVVKKKKKKKDEWCILGLLLINCCRFLKLSSLLTISWCPQYGWLFEIVHRTLIKLLPTYLIISNTQTWLRFHCEDSRTNRGTPFFVLAGTLAIPPFTCHSHFCGQKLLKTVCVSKGAPGVAEWPLHMRVNRSTTGYRWDT